MAIEIIDGFNLSKSGAIDRRFVAADQTERLALTWLYKGLLCYQVDNDTLYKYIGTPNSNLVGDWTPMLNQGDPGSPGSVWYNGSGVPSALLGVDDDYYLDNVSGDVYQKQSGTWVLITNIKGPTGASGTGAGDYASIRVTGGASGQSIDSTFVKCTQFTIDDPNSGAVPDAANNLVQINSPGTYYIVLNGEWDSSADDQIFEFQVRLNSVPVTDAIMTATFGGIGNNNQNINLSMPLIVTLGDLPGDLELYIRCTSGTTTLTAVTVGFGIVGVNVKGDKGDAGKALIHVEHDITLDDAKVTAVQAGSYTPTDPYSASVLIDNRSNLGIPAQIAGSKVDHSISYDGTNWYDNGIWRGPQGIPGSPGAAGAPGQGSKVINFTINTPGSHVIPAEPASSTSVLVVYEILIGNGNYTLTFPNNGTGNIFYKIILNSGDQSSNIIVTNLIQSSTGVSGTNQTLPKFYNYAVVPTNVRLVYIFEPQPAGYYQLTFPAPYTPPVTVTVPSYRAGSLTTTNPINTNSGIVINPSFTFTLGSYFAITNQNVNRQFKIFFLAEIPLFSDNGATTVRFELQRNVDGGLYSTLKTRDQIMYNTSGASFHVRDFVVHHLDTTLPTSNFTQLNYRVIVTRIAGSTLYRTGSILDATILPVYTGDNIV